MNMKCFKCGKEFSAGQENTVIVGPNIEVTCPFCFDKFEGKFIRYVEALCGGYVPLSAHLAIKMQQVAQYIELNVSEYYKERGKRFGKKKVRNV
jgi:hypothetical protein